MCNIPLGRRKKENRSPFHLETIKPCFFNHQFLVQKRIKISISQGTSLLKIFGQKRIEGEGGGWSSVIYFEILTSLFPTLCTFLLYISATIIPNYCWVGGRMRFQTLSKIMWHAGKNNLKHFSASFFLSSALRNSATL